LAYRTGVSVALGRRRSIAGMAAEEFVGVCERLGGAFLKAGQILSTRVDLLPPDALMVMSRLRDSVQPLPFDSLRPILGPLQGSPEEPGELEIEPIPLAAATIAQVHIGTDRCSKKQVAIKIRRPGVDKLLKADVRLIRLFIALVSRLPRLRRYPLSEAASEVCVALLHQVDFTAEALMFERFRVLFADNSNIKVPQVDWPRSSGDLIVMEYLEGYRPFHHFRDQPEVARSMVVTGLRALYKMIFNAGLIHCDLHPSNILCNDNGIVAILDLGFVSELAPDARREFAQFFLSIAIRDGKSAARVVRETALQIGAHFDAVAFERDMQVLVDKAAGRKAGEFQVAGFVFDLFEIQRRHGVYGSPSFTLPILSLLAYEGLIKDLHPNVDFQQEAVPFVLTALASSAKQA
jgi:ubiquinone biosynthesis protein